MYQTFLKPAFEDIKSFILDTLFPVSCLSCGQEGVFVCADCRSRLKNIESQRCIVCQKAAPFGLTHSGCQTPHGADGLICCYDYHDEKVAQIIIKGKYNFLPGVFKNLAEMIAPKLKAQYPNIFISTNIYYLVPVPLHPFRRRWRGFNQAEVLCQSLGRELNLPVADVLQRSKITKTQKDLKKEQRLKNLGGAFILKPGAEIRGQNLILADDVATTGATLLEAAKVLKRNGAAKVICLAVARD